MCTNCLFSHLPLPPPCAEPRLSCSCVRRRAASRALRLPSSRPMVFIQYFSDSDALAYEDFTLYDDRGGVREDRHVSQSNRCLEPYVLPRLTFQLARQAFEGRMNVQECVDECLADPNCHGFVTWQLECFYRGGAHAAANASTGLHTLLVHGKRPKPSTQARAKAQPRYSTASSRGLASRCT